MRLMAGINVNVTILPVQILANIFTTNLQAFDTYIKVNINDFWRIYSVPYVFKIFVLKCCTKCDYISIELKIPYVITAVQTYQRLCLKQNAIFCPRFLLCVTW